MNLDDPKDLILFGLRLATKDGRDKYPAEMFGGQIRKMLDLPATEMKSALIEWLAKGGVSWDGKSSLTEVIVAHISMQREREIAVRNGIAMVDDIVATGSIRSSTEYHAMRDRLVKAASLIQPVTPVDTNNAETNDGHQQIKSAEKQAVGEHFSSK